MHMVSKTMVNMVSVKSTPPSAHRPSDHKVKLAVWRMANMATGDLERWRPVT